MSLRVVGGGLGRTGTMSLKMALERLLGAPCHHPTEVSAHPEHVAVWDAAARGTMPDWRQLRPAMARWSTGRRRPCGVQQRIASRRLYIHVERILPYW